MINKINKAIDLLKSKYMIKFKQKVYNGKKYKVKYVLDKAIDSQDLLIVFTACTKVGQPARYNYIRTLDKYKCNKLFILDDFGFDNRGAYYLGKDNDFDIEKDVASLIDEIRNELKVNRNILIGSSKGGYAALYFGMDIKNSIVITGAPQYMLGSYLNLPGHQNILKYIMGNVEGESISKLNTLMEEKLIINKENNNMIYIHYSTNDETYDTDIKHLLNKLDDLGISTVKDIEKYTSHSELTLFFPAFIEKVLEEKLL